MTHLDPDHSANGKAGPARADGHPVCVLKFGSSVLRSADDLPIVALEIYRELRAGKRVVAVVSAFAGETDRLLADVRRSFPQPEEAALARLLATGETRSAALLGLFLEEVGVPAVVLDPRQVGLRTRGPLLDAEPDGLDVETIHAWLARRDVVVLPGFSGFAENGAPTLLGRGGSDMTALYLAQQLGTAECRLVKDVDGVYASDPHRAGGRGDRYSTVTFDTAIECAGQLIQPKALRFARDHDLEFVVSAPGLPARTLVGHGPDRSDPASLEHPPLRVALLGLGTVGLGVFRWLRPHPECFEIVGVGVRDLSKRRPDDVPAEILTDDLRGLLDRPLDVVVEVLSGTDPAAALVRTAVERGLHVVSANKEVLVAGGAGLRESAHRKGVELLYSASVGGGVPVLERLSLLSRSDQVEALEGVLNGTCNYILDRLAEGVDLGEATREAQAKGFAEPDPTQDLSGMDAVYKLCILAPAVFGVDLEPEAVSCRGLDQVDPRAVREERANGRVVRLVARLERTASGLAGRVEPVALPETEPLARARGEENRVLARGASGRMAYASGKGAGRWPTTLSVMADLWDLHRLLAGDPVTAARSGMASSRVGQ